MHINSLAAAAAIKPHAPTIREQVYELIVSAHDGLTREEIETALDMSGNTVRPRVRELLKAGSILESGSRPTASGQRAAVLRSNEPHQLTITDMTKGKRN